METRNVCAQVPVQLHRRLRIYTAKHDTCLSAILESLIHQFVTHVVAADEREGSRAVTSEPESENPPG